MRQPLHRVYDAPRAAAQRHHREAGGVCTWGGAEEQYGGWLLWIAYGLNLSGESGAFFTMCLSIITRDYLTNVLPTRHHKVDFLRTTNALGCMGGSMLITIWCC